MQLITKRKKNKFGLREKFGSVIGKTKNMTQTRIFKKLGELQ